MFFKAVGETTEGAFSLMERELPVSNRRPQPHRHEGPEGFYVLEGQIEFIVGDERRTSNLERANHINGNSKKITTSANLTKPSLYQTTNGAATIATGASPKNIVRMKVRKVPMIDAQMKKVKTKAQIERMNCEVAKAVAETNAIGTKMYFLLTDISRASLKCRNSSDTRTKAGEKSWITKGRKISRANPIPTA